MTCDSDNGLLTLIKEQNSVRILAIRIAARNFLKSQIAISIK